MAVGEDNRAIPDGARDQVHGRRTHEGGDECIHRPFKNIQRCAGLHDMAVSHDDDPVRERHCLDLVVRDVNDRGLDLLVEFLDFGPHLCAQFRVEVRERLVKQEGIRVADDSPAHGHTLPLAAGQFGRRAVHESGKAENAGGLIDCGIHLIARLARNLQAESQVLAHGHMRVERVILKHHRDVAFPRRQFIDAGAADPDLAVGNLFQTGDHAQGRGFPATRRTDQHDEFVMRDLQVNAVHNLGSPIALDDISQ